MGLQHFALAVSALLLFSCLVQQCNAQSNGNCSDIVNISQREGTMEISQCDIMPDSSIHCYNIFGVVRHGYYSYEKVMEIKLTLGVTNAVRCARNSSADGPADPSDADHVAFLTIKTINITQVESENFMAFTGLIDICPSFLWIPLDYELEEVDGYMKLPEGCQPSNLNDTHCVENFPGIFLKSLLPTTVIDRITVENLFFFERDPRIQSLVYRSESLARDIAFIVKYMGNIKQLEINSDRIMFPISSVLNISFPLMTFLRATECSLKTIPEDFIERVPNLEYLQLDFNGLNKVPRGLGSLKKLRVLNLSWQFSEIFTLTATELNQLTSLEFLELRQIKLKTISREVLQALTSLKYLGLSNSGLEVLPEDSFVDLTALEELRIDSNEIPVFLPDTFWPLRKLKVLTLYTSQIKGPLRLRFSTPELQSLDLNFNQITTLDTIHLSGNITFLNLQRNEIQNWTSQSVFQNEKLKIWNVDLSNNEISAITDVMGESLDDLQSLKLDENPFDCQSCELDQFQNWIKRNSTVVQKLLQTERFRCELPISQKSRGDTVINATYNSEKCKVTNYFTLAGLPVAAVVTIVVIFVLLVVVFRSEILHVRHVWNIKKRSQALDVTEQCEWDAFVTYSSDDRAWVMDVLLPALEQPRDPAERKYALCLHERDFAAGTLIMENIVAGIERSRRVILVLSPSFVRSQWCQWELRLAQQRVFEDSVRRDSLVLLELARLERDTLPLSLRLLMGSRTFLQWPAGAADTPADARTTAFWSRLRQALGEPLDRSSNDTTQ